MRPWTIGLLALSLALVASASRAHPPPGVGKPAADFTITLLDRQTVSSADLKGQVVVVNRWATWCAPCKVEMTAFEAYLRLHPGTDLKIYAVTTEAESSLAKLQALQRTLHFSIGASISGRGYRAMAGVPMTFVIDRSGVTRLAEVGGMDLESFDAVVTPLLKQPAPGAQDIASASGARP